MSNYKMLDNKIAFHPGYYIEEYIETLGLTQEDFAKRLGTTPKNISLLIRGEQSLSVDIASKLSRMIGTSVKYWLNIQSEYDSLIEEYKNQEEVKSELEVLKYLDYNYFVKYYDLPEHPRQKQNQVIELRKFLNVSSLTVFKNKDMYVRFRKSNEENESNMVKANIMVQIATNIALKETATPKFDKKKFNEAVEFILTLTNDFPNCMEEMIQKFYEAGVNLILLPNLPGSKINGATKVINKHMMLMLNDRNHFSDSFWFTLLHEVGHIMNGDYGISFENESGNEEDVANKYAAEQLIPSSKYLKFLNDNYVITAKSIMSFAKEINRNPGIVVGRLERDNHIKYGDVRFAKLKQKYIISSFNMMK